MYFRPLVTSLSGSRSNRSHAKSDGFVSTRSGPSSRNYSSAEATFDEKISAIDIVRDDGKTPIVKLSLTKTPNKGKLQIMQRVSWEVDYEDQSKLRHPGDLDLHENEHDIGVALSSASEEERHFRAGRKRSQSIDIIEATRRYVSSPPPRLQSMEPNSPFAWTETDPSQNGSIRRPRTATRDGDTFWGSDSESNHRSTKSEHSPAELQDGEKRWDIRRNPFRDGQHVVSASPTSRMYEGARVVEMKALGLPKSQPMKSRQDGR